MDYDRHCKDSKHYVRLGEERIGEKHRNDWIRGKLSKIHLRDQFVGKMKDCSIKKTVAASAGGASKKVETEPSA